MRILIRWIRFIVLFSSLCIAVSVYFLWARSLSGPLLLIRLTQTYALLALSYLYFALLATPLYLVFPRFPFQALYLKARRALGVSAFLFAALHGTIALFGLLGGPLKLIFLNSNYLIPVIFGQIALLILFIMAIVSFDYAVYKLGKKWKLIHRFVYLAGLLILLHFLMIGSHFERPTLIFLIYTNAITILLTLEAIRFNRFIKEKFSRATRFFFLFLTFSIFLLYISYVYIPLPFLPRLNIHAH